MEDKGGYGPPPAYPGQGQQPYPQGQPYPPAQGQPYPPAQGQPYPPAQGQPYPPPQGQQYPPPQGQAYPAGGYPAQGQPATVVVQQQPVAATVVVAGAGCPRCGGIITEDFTCLGICLAICFFPLGLLCCFLMRERKCSNCGAGY